MPAAGIDIDISFSGLLMKVYVLRDAVLKSLAVDRCASVERAVLCDRGSADQITVKYK